MAMIYKAKYLPIANKDILLISEALSEYPNKAKRLFREMDTKVKMVEKMPYSCPVYHANPEYRHIILEDHLLFYKVDENERKIKIYRILYSKMDIPKHI